jgi:proton-translocating NADH-quinone oxidoreductase chain L
MAPSHLACLLLLVPLLSAAVIACFLRRRGRAAAAISVTAATAVLAGALWLALGGHRFAAARPWLALGGLTVDFGIDFNDLAALMLTIVAVVGFCVHVFSLGYMRDDPGKARYFAGLSIFMTSMIGIVLADNLLMMFIFWELVGFSSWLLINHWHERPSAAAAAKKAFIVNRVGDFGFLLGIILCYHLRGTVNLEALAAQAHGGAAIYSRAIPLLLFCGAVGKSAQMPLHVWLPDAMEGPTPISALIHAATMVAAGIYMLCRVQMLMVAPALEVIAWVGTATAFYAALCAITQRDIKKVLAYSTLSQLGYMVAAFGLGSVATYDGSGREVFIAAGVGAAMFHLTTHAAFKALLFLGSGAVIHACHHEQDIFKMGGLRSRLPLTFITFTVAVAAICGLPFFAGFFSKDAILYLALERNRPIFAILAFTVALTALYMLRLWRIVFFGAPRSEAAAHAHEGGFSFALPMVILAVFSVLAGYLGLYPRAYAGVVSQVLEPAGAAHAVILAISLGLLLVGIGTAFAVYPSAAEDALERRAPALFAALVALKESFDSAYQLYIDKVQQRFAMALNFLDLVGLAGLLVRGTAGVVGLAGMGARALHVGRISAYAAWFLAGVAVLWLFAAGVF